MDGIHDLGGKHGFGPVEREADEPVFHAPWEPVVLAMMRAAWRPGVYNLDEFRHAIERIAPEEYLALPYYGRWLDGLRRLLREKGVVSAEELASREQYFAEHPEARAADVARMPQEPVPFWWGTADPVRETTAPPAFAPGDRVVTIDAHWRGHTRLPGYARGKRGTVDRFLGTQVFPDTHAHGLGECPNPLYSVRFEAQELWGEQAEPNQAVYLDLWERYLEPAP